MREAKNGGIHVHILASRKFRIESSAEFEQRCHAAVNDNVAARRMKYSRDNLQQRAFSRTVLTDDAEGFAALNLKADVSERREVVME